MIPLVLSLAAHAADLPDVDVALKTGAKADKDAAVVIGIEDYLKIPDVPYAQRDAKAMYDFLLYTRGIPAGRVRLLDQGASREQIVEAVTAAGTSVAAGGTVWVYFAGHGAADPSTGERMLLGDDVRGDPAAFASRGVSLTDVKKLAQKGGGTVNLIVDACYSGVGRDGKELVAGKRFAVPQRAATPVASVLEWNAASADQMSGPLDAAKHGAFTYFVLGAMRGWADGQIDGKPDGKVTAEEANLYVADALRAVQITAQKPEMAVATPKERVLSNGSEKAPALTASVASVSVSATPAAPSGTIDAANRDQTLAYLTSRFTACYDRLAVGYPQPELRRLAVRLRIKPGPKPVLVWNQPDLQDASGPLGQPAFSIGTCFAADVKATKWANPSKDVIFQDTLVVTPKAAELATVQGPAGTTSAVPQPYGLTTAVGPNGATITVNGVTSAPMVDGPPMSGVGPAVTVTGPGNAHNAQPSAAQTQRVTLVFKSKDGTWLDLLVDGDRVELRGLDNPRFAVTPGKHRIEVRAFMGKTALSTTTIDTGLQTELSIGLDGSGKLECYNCAN